MAPALSLAPCAERLASAQSSALRGAALRQDAPCRTQRSGAARLSVNAVVSQKPFVTTKSEEIFTAAKVSRGQWGLKEHG